jgi:hypothetical protein
MLQHQMFRDPERGQPRILAVFSYRYDAHLVPDFLENIRPGIHGYVAWDDRSAEAALSDEPTRRALLFSAARAMGADWLLTPDPDERLERGFAGWLPGLIAQGDRNVWNFTLREMFDNAHIRTDGPWGGKSKVIFFPMEAAKTDSQALLHAPRVGDGAGYTRRESRIIVYHLRMASPARRQLRRDLYAAADPERRFQAIGYDYLADERGMVLEPLPPGRDFVPPFIDDHGLWSPDPDAIGDIKPDPYEVRFERVFRTLRRQGQRAAHHVLADLHADSPQDHDLHILSVRYALEAGDCEAALRLADQGLLVLPGDLGLRLLRATALASLMRPEARAETLALSADVPESPVVAALLTEIDRPDTDLAAPDAAWRQLAPPDAVLHDGAGVARSDLATVVLGYRSQPGLLSAIRSLLEQDHPTEIVVVNSGGGSVLSDLASVAERIRLITCDTPLLVGAARNIGVIASRAPFVAFLAGDCLALPGWVSGRLARHHAGAASVSSAVTTDNPGSLVAMAASILHYSTRSPDADPRQVTHYGQSYSRRLLAQCGLFPPGLQAGEDTVLNRIAARFVSPVWAPEVQTAHHDPITLVDWLADERRRGRNRAGREPFRSMINADDPAEAVAAVLDQRLSHADALVSRLTGLSDAERCAIRAMQWLASQADRRGTLQGLAQLSAADVCDSTGDSVRALALAEADHAADPQDWGKARQVGLSRQHQGDLAGAEVAFRLCLALDPGRTLAATDLLALINERDGPSAAWVCAERLALAAPTVSRLWDHAADRALAAGYAGWAVALGQIALGGAVASPQAHTRLSRLHGRAGNALGRIFRKLTADRLRAAAAPREEVQQR